MQKDSIYELGLSLQECQSLIERYSFDQITALCQATPDYNVLPLVEVLRHIATKPETVLDSRVVAFLDPCIGEDFRKSVGNEILEEVRRNKIQGALRAYGETQLGKAPGAFSQAEM